jgi:hypothetical protein
MQRRIVETLAKQKGWLSGWAAIQATQPLADVDLDGDEKTDSSEEATKASISPTETEKIAQMLLSGPLSTALASLEDFRVVYEVTKSYSLGVIHPLIL